MKYEKKVEELKSSLARTSWPDGPSQKPGPFAASKVRARIRARRAIKKATRRARKRIGLRDIREGREV
jgi:hypothetical protein